MMAETRAHHRAKKQAAGPGGRTEVRLRGNRRLDALTKGGGRATEVERSGSTARLNAAARRLKKSGAPQRVLQVPQKDMGAAVTAMRKAGIGGTVKNMGGTKHWRVRPLKK
ncbi:MAG: hypothetical protein F4010_06750 [Cenarchaeum sp. SB0669_bin_11]|nr:hypothetical protein [Cenarchaeum sp. SB0669_bin_11]